MKTAADGSEECKQLGVMFICVNCEWLDVRLPERRRRFCKVFIGIASSLKLVVNRINAKLFALGEAGGEK